MNPIANLAARLLFVGGQPPGVREWDRFRRVATFIAFGVLVAVLLLPDPAQAQQLDGVLQWVRTNIIRVALSAAIIAIAIMCFALRFHYVIVMFVAAGGLIAANYQQIASLFPV